MSVSNRQAQSHVGNANYLFEADSSQCSFYRYCKSQLMLNELLEAVAPFLNAAQEGLQQVPNPQPSPEAPPQVPEQNPFPLEDISPEPAPLEPSSEEEESRRERELRASKEYKAVERHNDRRDTRIKEIRQRAKEIAQERGFNPDKCDAVEDAADYVASHAEELAEGEQLRYLTRLKHSLENLNSHTWRRILEEVKRWRP